MIERVRNNGFHNPLPGETDEQIYDRFVPLIRSRAWRVAHLRGAVDDIDECLASANLGFVQALRRWVPSNPGAFAQYAAACVVGEVHKSLSFRQGNSYLYAIRLTRIITAKAIAANIEPTYDNLCELDARYADAQKALHRGKLFYVAADPERNEDTYREIATESFESQVVERVDLLTLLQNTSDEEKTCLRLRYIEDCNIEEIREITGIDNPEAVIVKAMKRLRTTKRIAMTPEEREARKLSKLRVSARVLRKTQTPAHFNRLKLESMSTLCWEELQATRDIATAAVHVGIREEEFMRWVRNGLERRTIAEHGILDEIIAENLKRKEERTKGERLEALRGGIFHEHAPFICSACATRGYVISPKGHHCPGCFTIYVNIRKAVRSADCACVERDAGSRKRRTVQKETDLQVLSRLRDLPMVHAHAPFACECGSYGFVIPKGSARKICPACGKTMDIQSSTWRKDCNCAYSGSQSFRERFESSVA
jgi:RNA polymerase sigma factor (sigma-70 family)